MTVTTTSSLSNEVRAHYAEKVIMGAKNRRLYDAFAAPIPKENADFLGTSYNIPFMHSLEPSESAISQVSDIVPQALKDSTTSITPTSFGDAIQFSELLAASAYTNFDGKGGDAYFQVGEALMASLELLAKKVVFGSTATWVRRDAATRVALNAGTDDYNYGNLLGDAMLFKNAKSPLFVDGNGARPLGVGHSFLAKDLLSASGEPLLAIGSYQDKSYLVDGEIGMLGGVRLAFSPFAHVFLGAGAANSVDIDTTANGAITAGDTSFTLTTVGSLAAGMHLTVGTQESSTTLYPTTERVEVVSVASSVATIVGTGPNGGFKYSHATLTDVHADDDVYTMVYGGPQSMAKVFASRVHGPFGWTGDPDITGSLKQWVTIPYKFYGNYGVIAQNRLLRRECSSSIDA